jgi:hypothetical protein
MRDTVSDFLSILTRSGSGEAVFNPWVDVDKENDRGSCAPSIRRAHLVHYLESRLEKAQYLLIGEAVGYQGGHFSGIPMTSERILMGYQKDKGIWPEHVLPNLKPQRTSKPDKKAHGFSEPTATIVWQTILESGCDPLWVVLWNAYPWHPFDPSKGMLSNRKPTVKETSGALQSLNIFLELYPRTMVIATGKVAEDQLRKLNVNCYCVRHPAQGGASMFRNQCLKLLGN